nr:hypothetical protein BaRGS_001111 [Batillaria attramentaria]
MCVKCAMTNHKLHETEDLSARAALVKTQLSDENVRLQRRITQIKEKASLVTVDQQLAKDKQTVLEETVRNRQAALKALVDKFADDVVASLQEVTDGIRKADLNPLQESIKELTTSQQLLQKALNNDVDSELVALAKELKCKGKGEESAGSLPADTLTTVCRPVLRFGRAGSNDVFEFVRDYLDAIATYSPPLTPFRPSDVCFYNLGGQEVLLVADELNDAIHVVKTTSRSFEFDRYLSPGCPLLVRPTALNVDNKGCLWVASNHLTIDKNDVMDFGGS